ncbi:MAG TPA: CPBP family glutamic-type intramembrane protease [Terriglobales bacterium]|nr:CPBP family glutamic-type intramembrane protease [Terriglobales bacterium]
MDGEFPILPLQSAVAPAAPPDHDPPWNGLELTLLVVFTVLAIGVATVIMFLVWAIAVRALGERIPRGPEVELVWTSLVGQALGMALGFALAWAWLARTRGVRFWRAIHWRAVKVESALGLLVGGVVLAIAGQAAGHFLPMPTDVPMDRLFTPQTAWTLLVYGVAIAPFFEEFFFRGLLYPTLLSTFGEGFTRDELRAWRPLARIVAALALLGVVFWRFRQRLLTLTPFTWLSWLTLLELALLAVIAEPGWLLGLVRIVINWIAGWKHPQILAILVTGFLFGMMHAAQLGGAWAAVLVLVLVGVALTAVRAASGSVMASWLVHCAYNGTLFAAQYVSTQGFHNFQGLH